MRLPTGYALDSDKAPNRPPNAHYARGISTIELLLAVFLGLILLIFGGYLFKTQIGGYQDIQDQAKIQAGLKKSLQGMTRQIANAGGLVPNRNDFSLKPDTFTFAYQDLKGRFCAAQSIVIISYFVKAGESQDAMMEEIKCKDGTSQSRVLASVPAGGMDLTFRYLDRNGAATNSPSLFKAVQLDLAMQTGKKGIRMQKTRKQTIKIQCPNL